MVFLGDEIDNRPDERAYWMHACTIFSGWFLTGAGLGSNGLMPRTWGGGVNPEVGLIAILVTDSRVEGPNGSAEGVGTYVIPLLLSRGTYAVSS